ncbi:hypothetical protein SEA_SKOG_104 [Gordonia phage Skog]|uniref:Uncharacterized protein n=1 Tax=Gordonia phage Skog TaxID=2704033 RepID=A0A6G6XJQ3_9CAUD|nr:hypothetical protein KHQ85_gp104 [Gordonia phage Skog]QIG58256.1 hypothetical protein SEA_SKOG_104 [Gordonia phage Skog]
MAAKVTTQELYVAECAEHDWYSAAYEEESSAERAADEHDEEFH